MPPAHLRTGRISIESNSSLSSVSMQLCRTYSVALRKVERIRVSPRLRLAVAVKLRVANMTTTTQNIPGKRRTWSVYEMICHCDVVDEAVII